MSKAIAEAQVWEVPGESLGLSLQAVMPQEAWTSPLSGRKPLARGPG